jgi:four helix bundle protein
MKIERFEDIDAWQLARELTQKVYRLTKKPGFSKDYGLKRQIQDAAGSSMHNIAEGFDSETNAEFIRFLRYAKRSCTEVQSEVYVALDEEYISPNEFKDVYEQARRTRLPFVDSSTISRNMKSASHATVNREPDDLSSSETSTWEDDERKEDRRVNRVK